MARWRLVDTLHTPGMALKSALLSVSQAPRDVLNLPIVASWEAKVERARGSQLNLGGQLFVGYWPERPARRKNGAHRNDGVGPPRAQRSVLKLGEAAKLITGGWVILGPGTQIVVGAGATLYIGGGTYLSGNSQILCRERIEIGYESAIAFGALIMDSDSHVLSVGGRRRPQTLPVEIGNHVWMGAGVTVLKGATMGDGVVIGAGSVVTGTIPPKTLAAGVPARVIKDDVQWH
ncbi:MAG: acyltransferase [Actinomycetota bacterium]